MTVLLDDILDVDAFIDAKHDGFIRIQEHPMAGFLKIANYTEACVYERHWTHETLISRGLIFNAATGEVIARPFRKFFNHTELGAPQIPLDAPVVVTDKMDGSLGVWYRNHLGKPSMATRGSFRSDQALRATVMLTEDYGAWEPELDGFTPLFEIIYPENRIVVDYFGVSGLYLLGAVDKATGDEIGPDLAAEVLGWQGPTTLQWSHPHTYAQALAMPPRPGREGVVIDAPGYGKVKVKQEDYVTMHKLVTGLSRRAVWEAITPANPADSLATQLEDFVMMLPDEFQDWATKVGEELMDEWDGIMGSISDSYYFAQEELGEGYSRKDFALYVKDDPLKGYLFMMEDGKDFILDIGTKVWQSLRPQGDTRMFNGGADV